MKKPTPAQLKDTATITGIVITGGASAMDTESTAQSRSFLTTFAVTALGMTVLFGFGMLAFSLLSSLLSH